MYFCALNLTEFVEPRYTIDITTRFGCRGVVGSVRGIEGSVGVLFQCASVVLPDILPISSIYVKSAAHDLVAVTSTVVYGRYISNKAYLCSPQTTY